MKGYSYLITVIFLAAIIASCATPMGMDTDAEMAIGLIVPFFMIAFALIGLVLLRGSGGKK